MSTIRGGDDLDEIDRSLQLARAALMFDPDAVSGKDAEMGGTPVAPKREKGTPSSTSVGHRGESRVGGGGEFCEIEAALKAARHALLSGGDDVGGGGLEDVADDRELEEEMERCVATLAWLPHRHAVL
jgi:hypothetical protein